MTYNSEENKKIIKELGISNVLRNTGKALQFERSSKSQVQSAGRTLCDIADLVDELIEQLRSIKKDCHILTGEDAERFDENMRIAEESEPDYEAIARIKESLKKFKAFK